jgi:hypothetical protein
MENLDPIEVPFLINSPEVKKDMAEVKKDITEGTNAIEKASSKASKKVKEDMEQATEAMEDFVHETGKAGDALDKRIPQAGAKAKAQFNGLANSINQISRELPAFTYSAQTGFMAVSNNIPILVDEINRLRVANAAAAASGAATIPIWKSIQAAIFSWGTAITLIITLFTVFGKEIVGFVKGLFSAKDALDETTKAQAAMSEAFKSSEVEGAIEEVIDLKTNLDLAKKGLIDKKAVIDQYNESIGKTTELAKDLNDVEKGMIDNADNYIKATLYKAAAEASRKEAAEKLLELAKEQQRIEDELAKAPENINNASTYQLNQMGVRGMSEKELAIYEEQRLQKEKKKNLELQEKEMENANKLDSIFKSKIADLNIDFNKDTDPENTKGLGKIINARRQLLDKIAAIDAEYARKSFTKDEEEIQAIRDKFARVRELVERFNNDPKNKAKRIDLTGFDDLENQAVGDVKFRQETAAMSREIAKQKGIFQEYEQFKLTFGEAKAKERFGSELKGYDSFVSYLRGKVNQNQEVYDAMAGGTATGGQRERFELLQRMVDQEQLAISKSLVEIAKQYRDFETKQLADRQKFEEEKKALITAGFVTEAEEMQKAFDAKQAAEVDSHVRTLRSYKDLFSSIERLSDSNVKVIIQNAEKMLQLEKMSDEERLRIQQKIDQTKLALEDRDLGRIDDAAKSFAIMAREVGGVNTALGGMLGILGNILAASANIKANIGNLNNSLDHYDSVKQDQGATGLQKIGAVAGIVGAAGGVIGAVGSVVNSVIGYFKGLKKAKEEAQKAMEDFYQSAQAGELEYEKLIRERELKSAARGKSSYQAIIAQLELLKKQAPAIQEAYDKVFSALQGGEFAAEKGYKHGTWFRKAKNWDVLASLAGSDYERLEKLYLEGKLTDTAKRDFEALRDLRDELEAAGVEVEELQAQLNEMMTGTTTSGLADAMTELFRNGKMAAADFAQSFEEIMRNAIVNSFRYKYLEDALKPFYDELAALMSQGAPTQEQIDALKAQYQAIGQDAAETWKALEQATGINLSNGAGSTAQTGLSGQIRREMTEQTASELAGLFRGFYDISKRSFQLGEKWMAMEQKHFEATLEIMRSSAAIEGNTSNTVIELKAAVTELKEIRKNTKGTNTRDLGEG